MEEWKKAVLETGFVHNGGNELTYHWKKFVI